MYQQCTYNQLITWTHHWQLPSAASLRPASFCLRPPLLEGESTSVSVLATDRQVFMCSGLPVFGQIVAACTFSSRPDRKFGRFDILTTCLRKHCQCCHFFGDECVLIKLPRSWCSRFVIYFVLPKNTVKSHFKAIWLTGAV